MQAFKIDIMTLLVIAVVVGVGLTMALSYHNENRQLQAAPQVNARAQLPSSVNPLQVQFINASQSARPRALESRI